MKFNQQKLAGLLNAIEAGRGALRRFGELEQDIRGDIHHLERRISGHWVTQNSARYRHFDMAMDPDLLAEHKRLTEQLEDRKRELGKIRANYETEDRLQTARVENLQRCREFLEPYGIHIDNV